MDRHFSVIIPLYNRPVEIKELLDSLVNQTYQHFEVLVIEDGSTLRADAVVEAFQDRLDVRYFFITNRGQGFARNYGFEKARGAYFIIFDSDVLVPPGYMAAVNTALQAHYVDAYGGPDAALPSFSSIQRAINYAMTSFFTTGGIRGKRRRIAKGFHPRSFNMGFSRTVWEKTGGFLITRSAEDIELSIRIQNMGFATGLIQEALVYHKRRTDFVGFFKQLHFFGRARINVYTFFPKELKPVHFFPALFTLFVFFTLMSAFFVKKGFFYAGASLLSFFIALIFVDASYKNKSVRIGLLSVVASMVQLIGYGLGFITDFVNRIVLRRF